MGARQSARILRVSVFCRAMVSSNGEGLHLIRAMERSLMALGATAHLQSSPKAPVAMGHNNR